MSSQAPQPRRSKRLAEVQTVADTRALAEAQAVPLPAPSSGPHPVPDDIRELLALSRKLDKSSSDSDAWGPFLAKLQETLDEHQPGLLNIWHQPIKWLDEADYKQSMKWLEYPHEYMAAATLRRWIDMDAPRGKKFSLAVMTTPPAYRVGKQTRAEWADQKWHMWVLLTAHAPDGSNGKTIITYDTDVKRSHNESREKTALGFEYRYVQYIRQHKTSRSRDRVWQNKRVGQPGKGYCFKYSMEWLLGLVENGLQCSHRNRTLEFLQGFVQLKL